MDDFGVSEAGVDEAFEGYLRRHARGLGLESRVSSMGSVHEKVE